MNTKSTQHANADETSLELIDVEIDKIDISENRDIEEDNVIKIMNSIRLEGLHNPIKIRKTESGEIFLVQGGHRIEAFKRLGFKTIPATIYKGKNPKLAQWIENNFRTSPKVSENVKNLNNAIEEVRKACEQLQQDLELEQDANSQFIGGSGGFVELAKNKPKNAKLSDYVAIQLNFFKNPETARQAQRIVEHCIDEVVSAVDTGALSISKAYHDIVKAKVKKEKQLGYLRELIESSDAGLDKTTLRSSEDERRAEKRKVKSKPSKLIKQKLDGTYSIIYAAPIIKDITNTIDPLAWANRYAITWEAKPMLEKDICQMPVSTIANQHNCLLLLKVPSIQLESGVAIMDAWGFDYLNCFSIAEPQVTLPNTPGQIRYPHDIVLVGKVGPWKIEPAIDGEILSEIRDGLSNGVLDLVDKWFPDIELVKAKIFDNRSRTGWDNWFQA